MFSGIIESLGKIIAIASEKGNLTFKIESSLTNELKIDQSLAHNGVCLTVVNIQNSFYEVTAIDETLQKTNLGKLKTNEWVNLERCIRLNDRLDGHLVQGHIDQTGICTQVEDKNGSWYYTFEYDVSLGNVTVEKGSICVNGVSLTVVNSTLIGFSVAIIPYTYQNTTFQFLKKGDSVNLEFDILGKYIARLMKK